MGNWQERMRQMQEEKRRKIFAQEEKEKIDRQNREKARLREEASIFTLQTRQEEARLKSAKDAELRAKAENEKKVKFFETIDKLNVKQTLEDIRREVWQNQGKIIEGSTNSRRFVRLSFEFETAIPEIQHKEWEERVASTRQEHYELGGNLGTSYTTVGMSKSRVAAWHKVIMPSYLEVGINYPSIFSSGHVADLYVVDTDIRVNNSMFGEFASNKKVNLTSSDRIINYIDRKGNRFSKEPRPSGVSERNWILQGLMDLDLRTTHTSYSLNDHYGTPVVYFKLFHETESMADEFLNHFFAISSFLRKSQGKLPLQLQEQGRNYRNPIS